VNLCLPHAGEKGWGECLLQSVLGGGDDENVLELDCGHGALHYKDTHTKKPQLVAQLKQ
jgi:hypothetical protein